MADYIQREDALKYIKSEQCKTCSDIGLCGNCAVLVAITLLAKVPAADVAEVVRCRACKYRVDATINANGFLICDISDMEIAPDDFCSYGEYQTNTGGNGNVSD